MSALQATPATSCAPPVPPLRFFNAIPEAEAPTFAKLAREILRGHIGCDAERLGNDLYRAHYGDYARHEAALCVLDDLVALPDEAEEACQFFVTEHQRRRQERASARVARQGVWR